MLPRWAQMPSVGTWYVPRRPKGLSSVEAQGGGICPWRLAEATCVDFADDVWRENQCRQFRDAVTSGADEGLLLWFESGLGARRLQALGLREGAPTIPELLRQCAEACHAAQGEFAYRYAIRVHLETHLRASGEDDEVQYLLQLRQARSWDELVGLAIPMRHDFGTMYDFGVSSEVAFEESILEDILDAQHADAEIEIYAAEVARGGHRPPRHKFDIPDFMAAETTSLHDTRVVCAPPGLRASIATATPPCATEAPQTLEGAETASPHVDVAGVRSSVPSDVPLGVFPRVCWWSVGSKQHDEGACHGHVCHRFHRRYWRANAPRLGNFLDFCPMGVECRHCHYPHPEMAKHRGGQHKVRSRHQ